MMTSEQSNGAVLVVGGGVAGIQAALDLAEAGFYVHLVEKAGTIGGSMAQLDKTFPSNDCAMCVLAPKLVEAGRHPYIRLFSLSEVTAISGEVGNYRVTVRQQARYIDSAKCIACGLCVEKCPKVVNGKVDGIIAQQHAIFIASPHAVPHSYQIDASTCLRLNGSKACGLCLTVCDSGAINFQDTDQIHNLQVGAIILAPGFSSFDPKPKSLWGYGRYDNVITSLELERYLSLATSSPGRLKRPSDNKPVRKLAFLQCVGSRDEHRGLSGYCSSVCCMTSIKEAILAKEQDPDMQAVIFYQDIRTHGKGYDDFLDRARRESGIRFVRCRMGGVEAEGMSGDLRLRYVNEDGRQIEEYYDVVVLAIGLQIPEEMRTLAQLADISLSADGFAVGSDFHPVSTSRQGIFVCGAFAGPKDISLAVIEGSAAAAATAALLANGRHSLTPALALPEEKSTDQHDTRIGIVICHCGANIAGVVDTSVLAEYARSLPDVVHVENALFACAQDSQQLMSSKIGEHRLNRLVVAACSPRTHEIFFRHTLRLAGLNENLVEMANIRNHNAWIHGDNPLGATSKAKDLLRMAVAKVTYADPLMSESTPNCQQGLVVGGGIAGMTAALNLAEQGFTVHLVERTAKLGGNAQHLKNSWAGGHVRTQLAKLIEKIASHPHVVLHLHSTIREVSGFVGNFHTLVTDRSGAISSIAHGTTILATGGEAAEVDDYGYNVIPKVVTSQQFDKLYELKEKHVKEAKRFVFIQCVGSREKDHLYCSKVCCTHSVQSAITLKKENPERSVYILYRDMRTYAQREALFREARRLGVIFINYELHGRPRVQGRGQEISVEVWDHILHEPLQLLVDMVILAVGIRPDADSQNTSKLFQAPLDRNGFFQEAHGKLRPVDFTAEGVFVAGLAHYPKPIEESIAQALAAAARAATILSKSEIRCDTVKAVVSETDCDGCALCVDICPFRAITLVELQQEGEQRKIVRVNASKCKGCGICQGTCPTRGINVAGFTRQQFSAQLQAALAE